MPSPPYTIPGVTLATITTGLDAATTELNTEDFTGLSVADQNLYAATINQCLIKIAEARELVVSLIA